MPQAFTEPSGRQVFTPLVRNRQAVTTETKATLRSTAKGVPVSMIMTLDRYGGSSLASSGERGRAGVAPPRSELVGIVISEPLGFIAVDEKVTPNRDESRS